MLRVLWLIGGFLALSLAVIGIPLPGLPTVPFLLLAAFCFARSSDRFHAWLTTHPTFGPPINDWQTSGAIRPRGKRAAMVALTLTFAVSVALQLPLWVLSLQAAVLIAVAVFILTRPNG